MVKKLKKRYRTISSILALLIIFGVLPISIFAMEAGTPIHENDCNYLEAVEEVACDMGCELIDENGAIIHDESCSYIKGVIGIDCTCGAITYNMYINEATQSDNCTCKELCMTEDDTINSECTVCIDNILNCTGEDASEQNYEISKVNEDTVDSSIVDYTSIFTYSLSNGNVTITGFQGDYLDENDGKEVELVIPATITIDGTEYPITAIKDLAFYDLASSYSFYYANITVTKIDLSEAKNLTYIGESSFRMNCSADDIGELILPDGLITIGKYAFNGQGFSGDLTIPDSVESIGNSAFQYCGFDGTLTLPTNENFTVIEHQTFDDTPFTAISDIPIYITYIGTYALSDTEIYGDITIPEGVTVIGGYLFSNSNVTSITYPSTIEQISAYAFANVTSADIIKVNFSFEDVLIVTGTSTLTEHTGEFWDSGSNNSDLLVVLTDEDSYNAIYSKTSSARQKYLTYKLTLTFDGVDSSYNRIVLYNQPINLKQDDNGIYWSIDYSYTLPELESGLYWSYRDEPISYIYAETTVDSLVIGDVLYSVEYNDILGSYTYYEFGEYMQTMFASSSNNIESDSYKTAIELVQAAEEEGREFYIYDNGSWIYWFEIEPILWRYIDATTISEEEYLLLISEYVIDKQPIGEGDVYYSSLADTPVYEWLNSDFKDAAFEEYEINDFSLNISLPSSGVSQLLMSYGTEHAIALRTDYLSYIGTGTYSDWYINYFAGSAPEQYFYYVSTSGTYGAYYNYVSSGIRPQIAILPDYEKYTLIGSGTFDDPYKFVELYTYTFYDENGLTELKSETVSDGTLITPPEDPEKDATEDYTYVFDGWYDDEGNKVTEFEEISDSVSYYAKYTTVLNRYVNNSLDEGAYSTIQEFSLSFNEDDAIIYYSINYGEEESEPQIYNENSVYYITQDCTVTAYAEIDGILTKKKSWTYTTYNKTSANLTGISDPDGIIIKDNENATEDAFDIIYVADIAEDEYKSLIASVEDGYESIKEFHLYATVNGEVIENAQFNGFISVTIESEPFDLNEYKLLHLNSDGSIEIFSENDGTLYVNSEENYITFSFDINELSPFMLVSEVVEDEQSSDSNDSTNTNASTSTSTSTSTSSTYYGISLNYTGKGTIDPNNTYNGYFYIADDSMVTFLFTPSDGYYVSDVQVDGVSIGNPTYYTFANITQYHDLYVVFEEVCDEVIYSSSTTTDTTSTGEEMNDDGDKENEPTDTETENTEENTNDSGVVENDDVSEEIKEDEIFKEETEEVYESACNCILCKILLLGQNKCICPLCWIIILLLIIITILIIWRFKRNRDSERTYGD